MNRTKDNNILCIYYQFPPIKGIGTLRNAKFYSSLKKEARKVFVMTTSNRKFMPHDDYIINEENIIDIPTLDFRTIHHNIFNSQGSLMPVKEVSPVRRFILELINSTPLQAIIGEGGIRFIRNGIKQGEKLIKEESIDTVISSFRPASTHIIARQLKKKYPHLKWIADYRDITPDPMRSSQLFNSLTVKAHKRILKYADEVTTVSSGLKDKLKSYHNNVSVIRNGYENSLLNQNKKSTNNYFTLAYTGIVYHETQDGTILFKALRELVDEDLIDIDDLQFEHAGKDSHYWKELLHHFNLSEIMVDHGMIPREKAIEIQRNAHLNVLLTWASEELKGIVTGKIYEYLAARRPIVSIINGIKDKEIEEMVSGSKAGKVFYNNENNLFQLKSYILNQYKKWKAGFDLYNSSAFLNQYRWDYQYNQWNNTSIEVPKRKKVKAV